MALRLECLKSSLSRRKLGRPFDKPLGRPLDRLGARLGTRLRVNIAGVVDAGTLAVTRSELAAVEYGQGYGLPVREKFTGLAG